MISNASIVAFTSMIEDVTKVWHVKLRYLSDKGIYMLSKRGLVHGQSTKNVNFCDHYIFKK